MGNWRLDQDGSMNILERPGAVQSAKGTGKITLSCRYREPSSTPESFSVLLQVSGIIIMVNIIMLVFILKKTDNARAHEWQMECDKQAFPIEPEELRTQHDASRKPYRCLYWVIEGDWNKPSRFIRTSQL